MIRWFPVFVCLLGLLAAGAAQARPHYTTFDGRFHHINWGGATSTGNIQVIGLPRIQSAREAARLAPGARSKSPRSAPGERINRPDFGAGRSAASGRLTGRRQHRPIRVRKRVDAATPLISKAHKTKRPLPHVVMKGRDRSGQLATIELTHVMITSYGVRRSGDVAMEEITLVFEEVRMR